MKTIMCSLFMVYILFAVTTDAADDWTQEFPDPHPSARYNHAMAYIGGDQALLFGGYDTTLVGYNDETWIYDLSDTTWTQTSPASKPSARWRHAMAYIGGDRVLLFGGYDPFYDNDTWIYDLSDTTWTPLNPASKPSARGYHDMAYIGGDQVLLFGGFDGSLNDETWIYDLSDTTWTQTSPASKPPARDWHSMAYIGGDQVLLFGGYDGSFDDETWVYDLSDTTWTQQTPAQKPSGRYNHAMAYIGGDRVLLFGGEDADPGYDDETWVYDLSDDNWILDANTTQPSSRNGHEISETSMDGSSYLVLFGGDDGAFDDETWTFGGGDYPLPVVLSSFNATGSQGTVTLKWTTQSEWNNRGFHINRSEDPSQFFERITQELIPGAGNSAAPQNYTWGDRRVEIGRTYWYQLESVDFQGETQMYGPVSATPMEVLPKDYLLLQNFPNPFNPRTWISYQLLHAGPVTIRIYNVYGQLIDTLVDEEHTSGAYRVSWNGLDLSGSPAASGVYFCQLRSAQSVETIKMILLR
jgi:hypothetical protein